VVLELGGAGVNLVREADVDAGKLLGDDLSGA